MYCKCYEHVLVFKQAVNFFFCFSPTFVLVEFSWWKGPLFGSHWCCSERSWYPRSGSCCAEWTTKGTVNRTIHSVSISSILTVSNFGISSINGNKLHKPYPLQQVNDQVPQETPFLLISFALYDHSLEFHPHTKNFAGSTRLLRTSNFIGSVYHAALFPTSETVKRPVQVG